MYNEKNNQIVNAKDINDLLVSEILDPDVQMSGSGVPRVKNEENNQKVNNISSKKNPNKYALMLEELSQADSYPIFIENQKTDYSEFDSNIVEICNIIAETSPRVIKGKEIFALRTLIGYGFYTLTKPKVLTAKQVISELDSIENGIDTMLPWLTLQTPEAQDKRRNIAYVGTGNLKIHEEISSEIVEFLDPMCWSDSIGGDEESEISKYFLLVSLTPRELSRAIGVNITDPSFQKLIKSIKKRNDKSLVK